jgi:hypothetical protein
VRAGKNDSGESAFPKVEVFAADFGSTADMADPTARFVPVENDPKRHSAGQFCCAAQRRLLVAFCPRWAILHETARRHRIPR